VFTFVAAETPSNLVAVTAILAAVFFVVDPNVVVPGAEPIGSTANYEPFRRRVRDVGMRVYEGAPHNVCDAFLERCAGDVLDFLGRRFGLGA
jgi:hypothetical protein